MTGLQESLHKTLVRLKFWSWGELHHSRLFA